MYEVVVLGSALLHRSSTMKEGVERAEFTVREWVAHAAQLLRDDAVALTPKHPVLPVPTTWGVLREE
jgi:hypothetical protein